MSIYSQFNAEKILKDYIPKLAHPYSVEFGAGNGIDNSNTAHLIKDYGWRGRFIEKTDTRKIILSNYKGHDIQIYIETITPFNVNQFVPDNVGILSIDIDGHDYYVWEALNVYPDIVIIEYNPRYENDYIMDYSPDYIYDRKKHKFIYGASAKALIRLGDNKGYFQFGDDTHNLYFVKNAIQTVT